jgi:hypothetical protein
LTLCEIANRLIKILLLARHKGEAVKVILSRKGFDSSYGEQPSPILPDGTLLSLPIPSNIQNGERYGNLTYGGKSYFEILRELRPASPIEAHSYSHLDPDIRDDLLRRQPGWKGLFGQAESAQGHLRNKGVTTGDIFLFFGWFRQAELKEDGHYQYKRQAPSVHAIYGYLQIGKIYTDDKALPPYTRYHPHASCFTKEIRNNCLYEAKEKLDFNSKLPGWGNFKYSPKVKPSPILTKEGEQSRSHWALPDFFRDVEITYHSKASFKNGYFQAADRGQEFVVGESREITDWVEHLISGNYFHSGKSHGA